MILFTILVLIIAILIGIFVLVAGVVGASGLLLFGDIIICILLIAFLIKKIYFKKGKRK